MKDQRVILINEFKNKHEMHALLKQSHHLLSEQEATHPFDAIHIFEGWERLVNEFLMHRLDYEAKKHGDFLVITDIKYKLDDMLISYDSLLGKDYDDLITNLAT